MCLKTVILKPQTELAKAIQVSRQSISKYINDGAIPSLNTAIDIARHFGVSLDYLAGMSEYKSLSADLKEASIYTGLTENAVALLEANKEDAQHPLKIKIISQLIESGELEGIALLLEHALVCIHQYNFLYADDHDVDVKTNILATDEFQFNKAVTKMYPAIIDVLGKKLAAHIEAVSLSRWETMLENAEITIEKMQDILGAVDEANWKAYQAKKLQNRIDGEYHTK